MGGGGGGDFPSSDVKSLEQKAKESLKAASADTSRHVFISFANEDKSEVNLLRAQAKNEKYDIEFKEANQEKIIEFMVEEHDFSKERVEKVIEKLKQTSKGTQSSLKGWFK